MYKLTLLSISCNIIMVALLAGYPLSVYSQANYDKVKKESFEQINEQVWKRFIKTYNENDADGFLSIHSQNLLRISRDSKSISTYDEYRDRMKMWFESEISSGRTRTISFSFMERFHNENFGSEVGIFRIISNDGKGMEREYYGKFHVVLVNESGTWKILMDSDSNESGTINSEDFNKGFKMDDLDPFIN